MSDRPATAADVHRIASSMPHVSRIDGSKGNSIYQVGGKSFVFFRTKRPDAPFDDVIVLWVESDADKLALVQDESSPFFTTDHFNGHRSVLVRASELHRVGLDELTELIQDAWMSQASKRRAQQWLESRG
ncbi:MmcQ/YjbR family DNA-binding protein [Mycolicibacterium lacusdiani]|uniref:MmcQ/YjbR family DNA-binding protein n=1 Tax=Mycolicibacterium lacusdiani TaxID=2895283 RepID=UPI001F27F9FD|nr:MmcQ/YjbR family DNA-binding protein [Mycolicibacterium lacusdiani]